MEDQTPVLLVMFMGTVHKIGLAVIALVALRLALKGLDRVAGFDFPQWIRNADDDAISLYLAGRIIAAGILFGLIL